MITIILDTVKHKGKQILLLKFPYNQQLIGITKNYPAHPGAILIKHGILIIRWIV